ncbi:MAG TPA: RNA polymerase sigma factor [Solirubrobacteraceae bacterium]
MTAQEHFESLYSEHAGAVLAYARRRVPDGQAEDVTAEVFLTAWRRLDEIPTNTTVWLLGVARRVLANQRRSQARQLALRARMAHEPRGSEQPHVNATSDGRVTRALESLSEKDREVLLLVGWEELGHSDAARVLEIRAGTFAVRLHRARKRFEQALQKDYRTARPPTQPSQPTEAR